MPPLPRYNVPPLSTTVPAEPAKEFATPKLMRSAVVVPPFRSNTDLFAVEVETLRTMPLVASVDVNVPPLTSKGFQRPLFDVLPRFSAPLIVRLPPDTSPDAEEFEVPMLT